jgi:hypothetical protein
VTFFTERLCSPNTPIVHNPLRSANGNVMALWMHEVGHSFGLSHPTGPGSADDLMVSQFVTETRWGPWKNDIDRLRALYGARSADRVSVHRSTDQGASFQPWSSNLGSLNISTTMDPSAVRDNDRSIFFYTSASKSPCWIVGDRNASSYDTSEWFCYGGQDSMYGVDGDGGFGEYMMTWVDSSTNEVRVQYNGSANVGGWDAQSGWHWRSPADAPQAMGTPAIRRFGNTWVLAYPKLVRGSFDDNGTIAMRVSTDDGVTWSAEDIVTGPYRALSSVSLGGNSTANVQIGFTWDQDTLGINHRVRVRRGHLSGTHWIYDRTRFTNHYNRNSVELGTTSSTVLGSFHAAQGSYDTYVLGAPVGSQSYWSTAANTTLQSHTTPAIAAATNRTWAFLYTLND